MSILSLDTSVLSKCIECGTATSPTARFCSECGATQPSQAVEVATVSMTSETFPRLNRITWFVLVAVVTMIASWAWVSTHPITAKAQYDFGTKYKNGDGVQKDDALAVNWYLKAAEQGEVNAQFNLGIMYESGDGVPKDDAQAVNWYLKAAAQGFERAKERLADIQRDTDLKFAELF